MKLIIAGSRGLLAPDPISTIQGLVDIMPIEGVSEVVSGGCPTGPDTWGEDWAIDGRTPLRRFPADWKAHGPSAGPIRNRQMAEYADALLLIWDGESKGSASMLAEARKAGLSIAQVIMEDGR